MSVKKDFISKLQESDVDYSKVLDSLPNCYAKGYLTAKLNILLDSTDDKEEIIENLLECSEYNIWLF